MYFQNHRNIIIVLLLVYSPFIYSQESKKTNKVSIERSLTGFENIDETLSLWELGVGGGYINVANYPSSSQRNIITTAAPYVVYRGDIFRAGDGNGVRAVVVDKSNLEIGLSFSGAFSADSENGTVREGMPELDFLFEIGPQAIYKIKDYTFKNGGNARLNAQLQLRSAFSTDFSTINNQGFVLNPIISYEQRGRLFSGTALAASFGLVFATERFHDYFYEVPEQFITSQRISYDAKGGYLGSRLALSLSFPISKEIRGFTGIGMQINSKSANEDSPLYEKDVTYSVGLGFIWRFYKSNKKASW